MKKNSTRQNLAACISVALNDPDNHFYKPDTDEWPEDVSNKEKRASRLQDIEANTVTVAPIEQGGYLATVKRGLKAIRRGLNLMHSPRRHGKSVVMK